GAAVPGAAVPGAAVPGAAVPGAAVSGAARDNLPAGTGGLAARPGPGASVPAVPARCPGAARGAPGPLAGLAAVSGRPGGADCRWHRAGPGGRVLGVRGSAVGGVLALAGGRWAPAGRHRAVSRQDLRRVLAR